MRSILAIVAALSAPAGPAAAHDWYEGLTSPAGERCCNGRDCVPVGHRYASGSGRLEVEIDGRWVAVDPGALVAVPSPDGEAHACFWRHWMARTLTPMIRCVVLPGES